MKEQTKERAFVVLGTLGALSGILGIVLLFVDKGWVGAAFLAGFALAVYYFVASVRHEDLWAMNLLARFPGYLPETPQTIKARAKSDVDLLIPELLTW